MVYSLTRDFFDVADTVDFSVQEPSSQPLRLIYAATANSSTMLTLWLNPSAYGSVGSNFSLRPVPHDIRQMPELVTGDVYRAGNVSILSLHYSPDGRFA